MRSLGRAIKADSALEKKAERAKQTRKANISQLSAASTYYHPLNPLPNQIDHLVIIDFSCNPQFIQGMIALASKPVKTHIEKADYHYQIIGCHC
jgi:hypothetical protein